MSDKDKPKSKPKSDWDAPVKTERVFKNIKLEMKK